MEKTFNEWMDTFIEVARVEGYHGPIDRDAFIENYESGDDAFHVATEFAKERTAIVECAECLQITTQDELDSFGGLCEDCSLDAEE